MDKKLVVLLELTRKCNLSCKHCYNQSSPASTIQITFEEMQKVIRDLKQIEKLYPLERIILTGGEFVFMNNSKEIFKLIRNTFNCIIRIETNGFLFLNGVKKLKDYDADEYFISIDSFHNSLTNEGRSQVLDFFLSSISDKKKIIIRITIQKGEENLRNKFEKNYSKYKNIKIESKYVSPSGRAKELSTDFQSYYYLENPKLFKCLADNYILFNTSRRWFCCGTACELSYVANLGDTQLIDKFKYKYDSIEMKNIREFGILSLIKDATQKERFLQEKFYYRCQPCLYLSNCKLNNKLILLDIPAVDTTQDVYTKGFIFPTFTEKYLKPMLELASLDVEYYNLNKVDILETINYINLNQYPIYIHLTANKIYTYNLLKPLIKTKILLGGPVPKFVEDEFKDEVLIKDELEEVGILHFFNMFSNDFVWERADFIPSKLNNNFENDTINNDFSNIVLFSRGCIYNCAFCIHSSLHTSIHIRNIQSIEAELDTFKQHTSIYIADPSIGSVLLYKDILELLSKYKHLSFSFNVRADQINHEFMSYIKKINIDKLYIGVEDVNNDILKKYNKNETIETIEFALELLRNNNIKYHLSFIISNSFDINNIKKFDTRFKANSYSFHFYIPYPGTVGFKNLTVFNDKIWPFNITKSINNSEELKKLIAEYFHYPVNEYHTITPHDHSITFKIINTKINELEKISQKYNKDGCNDKL